MGYLGGISYSIMTAKICILHPDATSVVELLKHFFAFYRNRNSNQSINTNKQEMDDELDDDDDEDEFANSLPHRRSARLNRQHSGRSYSRHETVPIQLDHALFDHLYPED